MSSVEKKMVLDAADNSGFNLEFEVHKIVEKNKIDGVCSNTSIWVNDQLIEIDLMGHHNDIYFIMECKGSRPDTKLILIRSNESKVDPRANSIRNVLPGGQLLPTYRLGENAICTYTGDFYTKMHDKLKEMSKQDPNNHLYTAISQLKNALSLGDSHLQQSSNREIRFRIPMIVTGAEIWIVDYTGAEKRAHRPDPNYAIYECPFYVKEKNSVVYIQVLAVNKGTLASCLGKMNGVTASNPQIQLS